MRRTLGAIPSWAIANIKLALCSRVTRFKLRLAAPHELFQEVSSASAAIASIRAVLAVPALRGWPTKASDVAQAYIQARIDNPGCPKTWVRLPKSWWPASGFTTNGEPKYWDPVCPLERALYGHPELGAI